MTVALRTLLAGTLDYAGSFPPSRLPLNQAWANYGTYLESHDASFLGRFVCPLAGLEQMAACPDWPPRAVAVVIPAPSDEEVDLMQFASQQRAVVDRHCDGCADISLEIRLPRSQSLMESLHRADAELERVFVEVPLSVFDNHPLPFAQPSAAWSGPVFDNSDVATVSGGARLAGRSQQTAESDARVVRDHGAIAGIKFRTGGLKGEEFPTATALARGILGCRHVGRPWKATAGLHQPLTHFDPDLNITAFGFVNLLVAAALDQAFALSVHDLAMVLSETSASAFDMGDQNISCNGWQVDVDQIRTARHLAMISFGSCSFTEPWEGLRRLGWIS